jgi:hypothetical protein
LSKIIRKLPEQTPLVITGGVQFGSDKPGLYLTGDIASHCATILQRAVHNCPDYNGLLSTELQCITDIFWASKINVQKATSLNSYIATQAFNEAIGVVESVNAYLSEKQHSYNSPQDALKLQAKKIIQLLKQLQENS